MYESCSYVKAHNSTLARQYHIYTIVSHTWLPLYSTLYCMTIPSTFHITTTILHFHILSHFRPSSMYTAIFPLSFSPTTISIYIYIYEYNKCTTQAITRSFSYVSRMCIIYDKIYIRILFILKWIKNKMWWVRKREKEEEIY